MSIEKTCLNCGIEYTAKRSTSKFHSTSCRVEYMRKKYRIEANLTIAIEEIKNLGEKMNNPEDTYAAALSLDLMRKEINKHLPSLSSWWKCDNCGTSVMVFIPTIIHCNCLDNAKWHLVR